MMAKIVEYFKIVKVPLVTRHNQTTFLVHIEKGIRICGFLKNVDYSIIVQFSKCSSESMIVDCEFYLSLQSRKLDIYFWEDLKYLLGAVSR